MGAEQIYRVGVSLERHTGAVTRGLPNAQQQDTNLRWLCAGRFPRNVQGQASEGSADRIKMRMLDADVFNKLKEWGPGMGSVLLRGVDCAWLLCLFFVVLVFSKYRVNID